MQTNELNIAFIGAGNMASAIIGGLIGKGVNEKTIFVSAPTEKNLLPLQKSFNVNITHDNKTLANKSDVIILAVKPQLMKNVCEELKNSLNKNALIISIAAGITCASLEKWLGNNLAIVRCMPNTPSQIQEGASGLFANAHTSETQKNTADTILGAVGITEWVEDESLINSVIAVAGSAPAYFFMFIEAIIDAGIQQGLTPEIAEKLALQTAYGAAKLAKDSSDDVKTLRKKVTSPNGTTEQAILSFENNGLRTIINTAMKACSERAKEIELQSAN